MLKNTKSRQIIMSFLESSHEPVSAQEIFEHLKADNITLSSVYRTLDAFFEHNIVSKDMSSGTAKYSLKKDSHTHYLECRKCHKSTPLDYCPYHSANKKIKNNNDFDVDEQNIIIYGTCKDCRLPHKRK